tara:strand:- start:2766 stop:2927 length:162 start_codon:yes stop_codon:yes gene_type:complete
MLDTGTMSAIMIALFSALLITGLALRDNSRLTKENKRLRMRVRELNKQVEIHA